MLVCWLVPVVVGARSSCDAEAGVKVPARQHGTLGITLQLWQRRVPCRGKKGDQTRKARPPNTITHHSYWRAVPFPALVLGHRCFFVAVSQVPTYVVVVLVSSLCLPAMLLLVSYLCNFQCTHQIASKA